MFKRGLGLLIMLLAALSVLQAQELNCAVTVNHQQVEGSEKVVFEEMEKAVFEFVNNRQWTNDKYTNQERIDCSILITIQDRISTNEFRGTIQVQASRPVFNTSYNTPTMNVLDRNFVITYNQFEPLLYSETSYNGELPTILAFYVYMILGYDYDSFSLEGGTPYFQLAQRILNNAQSSPREGWQAFENQTNRYWLLENALNGRFKPLRKCYYDYHRLGLDVMQQNPEGGRRIISRGLEGLLSIHNVEPSSYNLQVFFNAKVKEVVDLYSKAQPAEKQKMVELLTRIDPGNSGRYQKILKAK